MGRAERQSKLTRNLRGRHQIWGGQGWEAEHSSDTVGRVRNGIFRSVGVRIVAWGQGVKLCSPPRYRQISCREVFGRWDRREWYSRSWVARDITRSLGATKTFPLRRRKRVILVVKNTIDPHRPVLNGCARAESGVSPGE